MAIQKFLVDAFEFLENGEELGISFQLDDTTVTGADFVYDGGNCAILVRNGEKAFLFTNIIKELRQKLFAAKQLMIIEEKEEEITNAYMVNVRIVEKIPYEDTMTDELLELMKDLKEVYGEEGVERISKELWEVK